MTEAPSPARPRFSVVTAVYNVERYLPDFIASLDAQRFDAAQVEIVAVDDGSTDGSLDRLRAWAERSQGRVRVFTKPNGGQASARNLGLEHATGEWVTFPDPDDMLGRDYFRAAEAFARANPAIELMSARPILLDDATSSRSRRHPREWQYADGNRAADLLAESSVFPALAPGSFYRLDRVRAAGLSFDTDLKPNFEDGHFALRYLLDLPRPVVGLLRDAEYVYRKRAGGDSAMQRSMSQAGRYADVLERGYLDSLERGRRPDGTIPAWIQQLIVYELSWYLSGDEAIATTVRVPPEMAPRFHALLDRILLSLDPAVVAEHRSRRLDPVWTDLLAHAARDEDWHSPTIVRARTDRVMRLRQYTYRFVGKRPSEAIRLKGEAIEPAFPKTMAHRYFDRDFLWERILWLPDAADLVVELNGVVAKQVSSGPQSRRGAGGEARGPRRGMVPRRVVRTLHRLRALPVRLLARTWPYRARYRDAWVLMDRIHDADDNGERLFEYLREARPEINAWFVLERGTEDWKRLAASGERRLVAHGSLAWKLLMLNCTWLLGSHVDRAIARPPAILDLQPEPQWRLGFLQHGVSKDDLSRWLNRIDLELFTVSTDAELASVAGDGTAYRWTTKETRETGLPRFDRLLAKGRAVAPAERDLVIVAPTWRQWLAQPLESGSQRRQLDAGFIDSEYVRNWLGILRSPDVLAAVAERGWRIGFMPHPNLQSMLGELDLPPVVERLSFAGTDVQDLYARCALLVTDYSSVAFNLAYIDRPVVYFQFDREAMLGGLHVGRKGYFDYARDGFGPVVDDLRAAEAAIREAVEHGPTPTPAYQERIDRTFPVRDGNACARVVAAVEALSRPWAGPLPAQSAPSRDGSV